MRLILTSKCHTLSNGLLRPNLHTISHSHMNKLTLVLVDVSSHVGNMRCRRPRCTAAAEIVSRASHGAYLGARLPRTATLVRASTLSSPGQRASEVRGVASARSPRIFRSNCSDETAIPRLMRGLSRTQEGPSWTQHLRASAINPSTWASSEAVRGLPFFHLTQSTLHRARCRG